jgi:hypothetical protein
MYVFRYYESGYETPGLYSEAEADHSQDYKVINSSMIPLRSCFITFYTCLRCPKNNPFNPPPPPPQRKYLRFREVESKAKAYIPSYCPPLSASGPGVCISYWRLEGGRASNSQSTLINHPPFNGGLTRKPVLYVSSLNFFFASL